MLKPDKVTIVQITTAVKSYESDTGTITEAEIFGLGDDQKVYRWQKIPTKKCEDFKEYCEKERCGWVYYDNI